MNSAILRNSGIAFLLMSALSGPVPAEAQQGAPSSAAQLEFDHGNAAFQAGNWSSAIEHYSQALNSSSDPRIVKNLALAYDNAGERELLAICYYHAFLEVRPRDPDVGKLRARIPELELTVESRMRALAEQLEKVVEKLPSEVGRMWFDTSLEKARTLAARAFAAIGDLPRAERIASATKVPSSVYLDIVSLQLQTFDFHGASRLLSNVNDWTQVPFLVHSIPRPNLFSFRDSEAADALAFIHSLEEELDRYFQWYEP